MREVNKGNQSERGNRMLIREETKLSRKGYSMGCEFIAQCVMGEEKLEMDSRRGKRPKRRLAKVKEEML